MAMMLIVWIVVAVGIDVKVMVEMTSRSVHQEMR